MYFKRIEMQGFKSFADPVTIELNNGITCIIGPNGSGKSNISDALRWVLGEQSPKQLRGGKMQEVIFAGTATRKPKGMAEVTLVIDNTSGLLPIEYNEVAVTRRMYRSGESEYLINGNQCRLRDIKELFMDTGIGVDGYSIIGQGKIADIVSNKADDRRAIFEEAAGVVLYKSRKADAENKLKAANENLERVRDIISEIEGRIGGLKEESEKATEYIGLRDRYKSLGINIILHNVDGLERNVREGRESLDEITRQYESAKSSNEKLDRLIEELRQQEASLSSELEDSNSELLVKIEELNLISNRGQINSEKLANIEKELVRLNASIEENTEKLKTEQETFDRLALNEKELDRARSEAEAEHGKAAAKLSEHTLKANLVNEQIEKSKDRVIELSNLKVSKEAEIRTLKNYQETLENRRETLKAEFEGRDNQDSENKAKLAELEEKLEAKKQELDSVKARGEEINGNIAELNERIRAVGSLIDDLGVKINRSLARKNTIEEMENNYEGYNSAVRTLMNRAFQGIIGTVSDIIGVPEGYETAIETALGGALQNIVCKDDESAKQAIRYLKSAKAGRATFLPITSVKGYNSTPDRSVTESDGFISVASEVVKADSEYRNIVEYLLGRVILADNMENAVKISKKKLGGFRIVTLDGEVINTSGAITGGKYANKTANILDRKKEIAELGERIEEYKKETERRVSERESVQTEISSLKEERNGLAEKYQAVIVEYNILKTDLDHAVEKAESDDRANSRMSDEIVSIEDDITRASNMISGYSEAIEAADKEISMIEDGMGNLYDDADRYKAQIEEDNENIVTVKVSLGEIDAKILAQNEMIERVRDVVTDLESSIEDDTCERAELENTRILLNDSGQESTEKEAELKASKENLEKRIEKLNSDIETSRADYETSRNRQKSNTAEMEKIADEKYKLELKNARNETLLDAQKDKLWDEFEVSYAEACDMREENFAITAGNREIKEIKVRMAELGDVNISSIEEYKQVSKRYTFMTEQEADTAKAMHELEDIIRNMERTIRTKFKETFDTVVVNFEETFKELFGGGNAELTLEDENNPLESSIEITAQPPGKKLKNINLLSGGEKTLTAIALMFAVLKAKPTPFCILDEVEAALDEVNIERFSGYLRNFKEVQFALITHQKATMEHADVLYGVTMPEQGISRMLSIKMDESFDLEEFSN